MQSQIDGHKADFPVPFMDETEIKAICCCFKIFHKPINVLEWGSGNSTTYFSEYLPEGSEWHSVEHNPRWVADVQSLIDKLELECQNIHLHHVSCIGEFQEGSGDGCLETFRDYVLFPIELKKTFKIVIVDGRARIYCMKVGWQLLDNNGVMILHDAQRKQYNSGIPDECYWLRMVNPDVICEDKISTIFIGKSHDVIKKIGILIRKVLPDSIEISNNLDGNGEVESVCPSDPATLNNLGAFYLNTGNPHLGLEFFHALSKHDSRPAVLNSMGICYEQLGHLTEAVEVFQKSLSLDRSQLDVLRAKKRIETILRDEIIAQGWSSPNRQIQDLHFNVARFGDDECGWSIIHRLLNQSSVVYCVGCGENISFDTDLMAEIGCSIHAFDPTPKSLEYLRSLTLPENYFIHEFGLGHFDGNAQFNPPVNPEHVSHTLCDRPVTARSSITVSVKRLSSIMNELGHQRLDLLKMDIEGAEYMVLEDIVRSQVHIGQICVEFHHFLDDGTVDNTLKAILLLNQAGYMLFHTHGHTDYSFVHKSLIGLEETSRGVK